MGHVIGDTVAPYLADNRFAGAVEAVDPRVGLSGWALDAEVPGAALVLHLRAGRHLLATVETSLDRPDVDGAAGRRTRCGFRIGWDAVDGAALAEAAMEGASERLHVTILSDGARLPWLCAAPGVEDLARLVARAGDAPDRAAPWEGLGEPDRAQAASRAPVVPERSPGSSVAAATPPAPRRSRAAARRRSPIADSTGALSGLTAALAVGDVELASTHVGLIEASGMARRDPEAALALSRYHHAAGDASRSAGVLLGFPVFPAIPIGSEAAILHRLIEEEASDAAAARLDAMPKPFPPELYGPRVRLAARREDVATLSDLLDEPAAARLPAWQIVEATFRLVTPDRVPAGARAHVLARLEAFLVGLGLQDAGVVAARIHMLLHGRRWGELGAVLRAVEGTPVGEGRELLMRRLEYLCHVDPKAADRLYRERFAGAALGRREGVTVIRLLGEIGRWDEASGVLLAHVGRGQGFGDSAHVAMRVVRRLGLHEAVLERAERANRGPELATFLRLVEEDLALRRAAAGRGWRSGFVLGGMGVQAEAEGTCSYVCTNRRYFLSMLTFLCSFLGQSPQVGGRVYAFLDRDVPRHWWGAVAMVAARFGRPVEVVGEEAFLPEAVEHREAYGFFAGGGALSRAAYFRLYAARWLRDQGAFRRVAYLDTDTICRGDLSELFELEMGEGLIAAALEDPSPDVAVAASRNGLDAGAYFNSGVLLLRFDHPDLAAGIEEAIRVAEAEPERLVFHDQCALNIAFQGRAATLPRRYNFFLRPGRERNGHLEDGLLLHFLDRPKPWDITFDRPWREEWRVWALVLSSILPHPLYLDIFAAANEG